MNTTKRNELIAKLDTERRRAQLVRTIARLLGELDHEANRVTTLERRQKALAVAEFPRPRLRLATAS